MKTTETVRQVLKALRRAASEDRSGGDGRTWAGPLLGAAAASRGWDVRNKAASDGGELCGVFVARPAYDYDAKWRVL